jgi:hypothetical protein
MRLRSVSRFWISLGRQLLDHHVHQDALGAGVREYFRRVLLLRREVERAHVHRRRHQLVPHAGSVQHQLGVADHDPVRDLDAVDLDRQHRAAEDPRGAEHAGQRVLDAPTASGAAQAP